MLVLPPEKVRLARNIKEGMEIWDNVEKTWTEVTNVLYVTAPLAFVRFEFADNSEATVPPHAKVLSRPAQS